MERKTDINFSQPSCSEPFPIVLYTSFKIYLNLIDSQRTHSSFINIVSAPCLQTGTFYDNDQLLELSKKFQLLVNIGFLLPLSLLGPGSIFRGQKKTNEAGSSLPVHDCSAGSLCFFLGGTPLEEPPLWLI